MSKPPPVAPQGGRIATFRLTMDWQDLRRRAPISAESLAGVA
ncbi:hypothetical protein [Nodosilinea sp. LEGE 07298]|nr:hypothetical protein [Nodosilinea sp. LEGE 07298]